jgi:hypothetical protein
MLQSRNSNFELWVSLLAIGVVTFFYLGVVGWLGSIPAARGFFGHSLGVIGLLLMLFTEIGYSLRKRSRSASWGKMATWLQFHIFSGLVGPYLALLHTAWSFNGLAGIVVLLTAIVVISGFFGRYIFTAIPRTAEGVEVETDQLEQQIAQVEAEMARLRSAEPEAASLMDQRLASLPEKSQGRLAPVLGRYFEDRSVRSKLHSEEKSLDQSLRVQAEALDRLVLQRRALQRQVASLGSARQLLSIWHTVHIPIGMALFAAAFIHGAAALYYATLIH